MTIRPELQTALAGDFWRFTPEDFAMPDGPGAFVMELQPSRAWTSSTM